MAEYKDFEYRLHEKKWLQVWRKNGEDGITWDELQEIKNVALGEEVIAIEIYPAQSQLVNLKNVRHLWVLSCNLPNLKKMIYSKQQINNEKLLAPENREQKTEG